MTLVVLVLLFMLIAKSLMEEGTGLHYRCLRCGASRPDMHSKWCDQDKA